MILLALYESDVRNIKPDDKVIDTHPDGTESNILAKYIPDVHLSRRWTLGPFNVYNAISMEGQGFDHQVEFEDTDYRQIACT